MSKAKETKKEEKKKPTKTLKEKRAAKKEKKGKQGLLKVHDHFIKKHLKIRGTSAKKSRKMIYEEYTLRKSFCGIFSPRLQAGCPIYAIHLWIEQPAATPLNFITPLFFDSQTAE